MASTGAGSVGSGVSVGGGSGVSVGGGSGVSVGGGSSVSVGDGSTVNVSVGSGVSVGAAVNVCVGTDVKVDPGGEPDRSRVGVGGMRVRVGRSVAVLVGRLVRVGLSEGEGEGVAVGRYSTMDSYVSAATVLMFEMAESTMS